MAASSALALAAARPPTYQNPFGFGTAGRAQTDMTGGGGQQMLNPSQPPRGQQQQSSPAQTAVIPIPSTQATTPGAAGAPTPTVNTSFDLQTDPALQQVNALAGLSDQQANAQALKQRQQELIQYGDPRLAAAVLGANDPTVQAAGQNQESDLAMLGRERDQNLRDFENHLDPSLAFSGYRVGQEHQLGQAYQDALAKAASGVQGSLDSINGNLNAALGQNTTSRINALGTAEANQLALALAGLSGGSSAAGAGAGAGAGAADGSGAGAPPPVSGGNTPVAGSGPLTAPDYNSALALAAATHQPVALTDTNALLQRLRGGGQNVRSV